MTRVLSSQELDAARATFDADGVVCIRRFAPSDEVAGIVAQLERFVAVDVPRLRDGSVVVSTDIPGRPLRALENLGADPFFEALGRSSQWLGVASALLDTPVAPAVPDGYSNFGWQALFDLAPDSEEVTPPHQDNAYYWFTPPIVLSMWLALDPTDSANGALRYVRGSHLAGLRPHRPGTRPGFSHVVTDFGHRDVASEIQFDLEPGDLVVHHGLTIHLAGPNRSPRRRWGYAAVFRAQSCSRDALAHTEYTRELEQHNELLGITPHRDVRVDRGATTT
jgi:phytanoyl-CoA hydroxylase